MKRLCKKCGVTKPIDEFPRARTRSTGYGHRCKACKRNDYRENIEAVKVTQKAYSQIRGRDMRYQRLYGITLEEYNEMLDRQGGACKICNQPPGGERALAVDHDHGCCPGEKSCGRCVRSLLCAGCNSAIGLLREDPVIIRAALLYVEGRG